MTHPLQDIVLFVVGGGTDAPGFKIVPDGHGGYKVVPVPGWNPEQMIELSAALQVISAATRMKHPEVSRGILNSATKLAATELGGIVGKEAGGAGHVVVVVAG